LVKYTFDKSRISVQSAKELSVNNCLLVLLTTVGSLNFINILLFNEMYLTFYIYYLTSLYFYVKISQ